MKLDVRELGRFLASVMMNPKAVGNV